MKATIQNLSDLVMNHGVVSGRTTKVVDLPEPLSVEVVNPSGHGTRTMIVHNVFVPRRWFEPTIVAQTVNGETFFPGRCLARDFRRLFEAVEKACT